MNTLTQARKSMDLDDLTTIRHMAQMLVKIANQHPEMIEETFGAFLLKKTAQERRTMVEFYAMQAHDLSVRLEGTCRVEVAVPALIEPCSWCKTDKHPKSTMQPQFCIECVDAMLKGKGDERMAK